MAEEIKPIYEAGNSGLITRKLNASGSDYVGVAKKWFSDNKDEIVSTSITFTQTATDWASGNNPSHVTTTSVPTGTGTLTLFGVRESEWQELLNVNYSEDWGVGFAPDDDIVHFGFAFDVNRSDGSKTKIFVPKARFDGVPSVTSTTNTADGEEIQNVEIPVTIFPIYKNSERLSIYYRINSIKNTFGYETLKDTIVLPITVTPEPSPAIATIPKP